eukprot:GGOE01015236.1.p1 GENE.GGOE01015236.1~~GGOE01015236.1.p1  ORF type:complete len:1781 (+),score=397.97 GGOE01015236.1:599-5344(+)
MVHYLHTLLPQLLGFSSSVLTGVYIRPRRSYDHVIRARHAQSLPPLLLHLTSRPRPSASLSESIGGRADLPLCKGCTTGRTSAELHFLMHPTQRLLKGMGLCGSCLERSLGILEGPIPKFWHTEGPKVYDALRLLDSTPTTLPAAAGVLAPAEGLVSGTLSNGLSYVILPNRDPADTIVTYLQVNAGSINETEKQQGMAHMLEHMVFAGSEKYPNEATMTRIFNAMGMSFGADANAFTMFRQTTFSMVFRVGKTDLHSLIPGTPPVSHDALRSLLGWLGNGAAGNGAAGQAGNAMPALGPGPSACRTCQPRRQSVEMAPSRRRHLVKVTRRADGQRVLRACPCQHQASVAPSNQKGIWRQSTKGSTNGDGDNRGENEEEEESISLAELLQALHAELAGGMDAETHQKILDIQQLLQELDRCSGDRCRALEEELTEKLLDPDVLEELSGPPNPRATSNLEIVLDLLRQMLLHCTLPADTFASERLVVLSEMVLRGTLDYTLSVQEQEQLFPNSILNDRQPIGKKEIIERWTVEDLREFHRRWYYPGNMCLYIVGNVNPGRTVRRIEGCFDEEPPRYAVRQPVVWGGHNADNYNALLKPIQEPLAFGLPLYESYPRAAKDFHSHDWTLLHTQLGWTLPTRPVQLHPKLQDPPVPPDIRNDISETPAPFRSFHHPLNMSFYVALQCRTPVTSTVTENQVKLALVDELAMLAWATRRAQDIESSSQAPFQSMDLVHGVSYELNSGTTSFVLGCRPSQWKLAISTGLLELKRFYTHGLTAAELGFQLGVMAANLKLTTDESSSDLIDVLLEDCGLRSTFLSLAGTKRIFDIFQKEVTLEQVNRRIQYLLAPLLTYRTGGRSIACVFCSVPEFYECDALLSGSNLDTSFGGAEPQALVTVWTSAGGTRSAGPMRALRLRDGEVEEHIHLVLALDDPGVYSPIAVPRALAAMREVGSAGSFRSEHHLRWADAHLCRLSNGLAFNYKVLDTLKGFAVVRLSWGYGYAWMRHKAEDPTFALAALLRSGAGQLSQLQIDSYAALHGIRLEPNVSEKTFNIMGYGPATEGGLVALLTIMWMYWTQPRYETSAVQRLKADSMLEAERQQLTIESSTLAALHEVVFQNDVRFTSPSCADFAAIRADAVRDVFDQFLSPANAELMVLGDVDAVSLKATVLRIFGNVPYDPSWKVPPAPSRSVGLACQDCYAAMGCPRPPSGTVLGDVSHPSAAMLQKRALNVAGAPAGPPTLKAMPDAGHAGSIKDCIPRKLKAVTEDGPVPSLDGLNVSARVQLRGDLPRGVVYLLMPWPNAVGELPVRVGGVQYVTPAVGDGYHVGTFPSNGSWSRADVVSHPCYVSRCLDLLGRVLENRLFQRVRSELGLCYSIYFQASVTRDYDVGWSLVTANSFADDRRINMMVLAIVAVMQELVDTITHDEFEAVRKPLVSQALEAETSIDTWLTRLSDVQLPHSNNAIWHSAELATYFQALTLEDVVSVARQKYHPTPTNLYIAVGQSKPSAADFPTTDPVRWVGTRRPGASTVQKRATAVPMSRLSALPAPLSSRLRNAPPPSPAHLPRYGALRFLTDAPHPDGPWP